MIELRRVLSYPPMTTTNSSPSPTSTSTSSPGSGGETHYQLHTNHHGPNNQAHYYEFKILDPMFSNASIIPADEANIPNVEELIMTRIDFNHNPGNSATFYNGNQRKKMEISERKINSTTLSTKWTYATPNSNGQPKTVKRRKKNQQPKPQQLSTNPSMITNGIDSSESCITTNSSSGSSDISGSPNSSHSGATSRKERSLHYCNICNKGFKDKYSVNVHLRVHSGKNSRVLD